VIFEGNIVNYPWQYGCGCCTRTLFIGLSSLFIIGNVLGTLKIGTLVKREIFKRPGNALARCRPKEPLPLPDPFLPSTISTMTCCPS
jgi:hypothetical protein